MVLERVAGFGTTTSVAMERSRSTRVFSPYCVPIRSAPPKDLDIGADGKDDSMGMTAWSPSRRRSRSQNQIRKTFNGAKSTTIANAKQPRASNPLRLRTLPLSFMAPNFVSTENDARKPEVVIFPPNNEHDCKWRRSPQSKASPSQSKPRNYRHQVHLAPLKRVSTTQCLELQGLGNQEDSMEDSATTIGTSEDVETSCDNQLDHHTSKRTEKSDVAPQGSPRPTYLPRLATLDLIGDSRYLLRHSSSSVSPTKKHWTKAERICDEIYTTECSYVRDLKTLLHHFFEPLQEYAIKHTISLGAITALHSSIKTILQIHKDLLQQVAPSNETMDQDTCTFDDEGDCDESEDVTMFDDETSPEQTSTSTSPPHRHLGNCFAAGCAATVPQVVAAFDFTIEYMKVYAFYCSSYLSAKDELALLQKKYPGLDTLTTQLDEHARQDLHVDIVSHMIKPVQRICRYPLLFRELLKNVNSEQEVEMVERTLHKIESVSAQVNEKVREAQHNARLYELHQTVDPKSTKVDLLQPSRTLLCEMTVRVVSPDSPRWPSFVLRLRRKQSGDLHPNAARRNSVDLTSTSLLSPPPSCSSSSRSLIAPPSSSSLRPPLLSRRTSGEHLRLILLSDVLLMAKKCEEKLKVKRQLCLSCAHVSDSKEDPASNATPWSFTMEVSKVGRCHCHQLTPVTLKRSPKRRTSLSLVMSGDLFGTAVQSKPDQQQPSINPHQQNQAASPQPKTSGFFRGSELCAPFRSTKLYIVICDSEQQKREFLAVLQSAIAKRAVCAVSSADASKSLTGASSVCEAAKLSGRFWRRAFKHQLQQQLRPRLQVDTAAEAVATEDQVGKLSAVSQNPTESNAAIKANMHTVELV